MNNPQQENPTDMKNFQKYTFSNEELQVLAECNNESFYKRSLPLSSVLASGTFFGIKAGYLKGSARFGVFPKVVGAALIGFVAGKLSYRNECAKKFMTIPDSQIGEKLRQRYNVSTPFGSSEGSYSVDNSLMDAPTSRESNDPNINNSLNMDTDRPAFSVEDSQHNANSMNAPINLARPQPSLSYDDLRKQNRDDHEIRRSQPYKMEERPPPVSRPTETKNKYGDVMN